jgi:hypothetical protein
MVESNQEHMRIPFQLDPVEHAVVEASWGTVLINDNSELLRAWGTVPLRQLVEPPEP